MFAIKKTRRLRLRTRLINDIVSKLANIEKEMATKYIYCQQKLQSRFQQSINNLNNSNICSNGRNKNRVCIIANWRNKGALWCNYPQQDLTARYLESTCMTKFGKIGITIESTGTFQFDRTFTNY